MQVSQAVHCAGWVEVSSVGTHTTSTGYSLEHASMHGTLAGGAPGGLDGLGLVEAQTAAKASTRNAVSLPAPDMWRSCTMSFCCHERRGERVNGRCRGINCPAALTRKSECTLFTRSRRQRHRTLQLCNNFATCSAPANSLPALNSLVLAFAAVCDKVTPGAKCENCFFFSPKESGGW